MAEKLAVAVFLGAASAAALGTPLDAHSNSLETAPDMERGCGMIPGCEAIYSTLTPATARDDPVFKIMFRALQEPGNVDEWLTYKELG